jgi:hypothetical protein
MPRRFRQILQWRVVRELATEALTVRSKDLEVAAWLTEALLRDAGLSGLTAGFRLLALSSGADVRALQQGAIPSLSPCTAKSSTKISMIPLDLRCRHPSFISRECREMP